MLKWLFHSSHKTLNVALEELEQYGLLAYMLQLCNFELLIYGKELQEDSAKILLLNSTL